MKSPNIEITPPLALPNARCGGGFHPSLLVVLPLVYVFDEVLNGLLGSNLVGALLLLLWIGILSLQSSEILRLRLTYLLFYGLIVLASLAAYAQPSGCHVEVKGAMSLVLLGILISLFPKMSLARIAEDERMQRLILILILVLLAMDTVGIGVRSMLFGFSKGAGPYSEPSHIAVYLLPVIAVRMMLSSLADKFAWAVLIAVLALAPSSTLLLGTLGGVAIFLIASRGKLERKIWIFLTVALITILTAFAGGVDMALTVNRLAGVFGGFEAEVANHENLSALVWLNGWSQAAETLSSSGWLGAGFNQMGCGPYSEAGVFSPLMLDTFGVVLNANDGSLLAAKLIADLGIVGLVIVFILSMKSVAAILASRKTGVANNADHSLLIIRAVGGLTVLMYLYVRGMGYFQLPLLLGISMLDSKPSLNARCDHI